MTNEYAMLMEIHYIGRKSEPNELVVYAVTTSSENRARIKMEKALHKFGIEVIRFIDIQVNSTGVPIKKVVRVKDATSLDAFFLHVHTGE